MLEDSKYNENSQDPTTPNPNQKKRELLLSDFDHYEISPICFYSINGYDKQQDFEVESGSSTDSKRGSMVYIHDEFSYQPSKRRQYKNIMINLLVFSIPNILCFLSMLGIFFLTLHFIGKQGNTYLLDGVGLANSFLNCCIFGVIVSLNYGLISLAAQAWGSQNYELVGLYFHRSLIINCVFLAIVSVLFWFSDIILIAIGTPLHTALYAHQVIIYMYGGIFSFILFDGFKSYLLAQDIFIPQLVVQIIICLLHWLWCYIFIEKLQLEAVGVALSITLTYSIGAFLLFGYITIMKPREETWFWFNQNSFKMIWSQFKVECQIGCMTFLEWIAYELLILYSTSYSVNDMASQVGFNMIACSIAYIPGGLSLTLNTFVGNAIGQKDITKTSRYAQCAIFINSILIFIGGFILYFLKDQLANFFSRNSSINLEIQKLCTIYIIFFPADSFQCILNGFLRAIGKERSTSIAFFISYYGVGLVLAYVLGSVYEYNIVGIWIGLGIGMYCMLILDIIIVAKTNLMNQSLIISERLLEHYACSNHKKSLE